MVIFHALVVEVFSVLNFCTRQFESHVHTLFTCPFAHVNLRPVRLPASALAAGGGEVFLLCIARHVHSIASRYLSLLSWLKKSNADACGLFNPEIHNLSHTIFVTHHLSHIFHRLSTFVLRGMRGTYGTGLALVARLVRVGRP